MLEPTDRIGGAELHFDDCMKTLPYLDDASYDCVLTDPPYGMEFQSKHNLMKGRFEQIANDDQPYVWWLRDAARCLKDGGCLICFCRWDSAEPFRLAISWAGLKVTAQLIWDRKIHGMGDLKGSPAPQHDTIWFATKGKYQLPGARPKSVYPSKRETSQGEHPNQKPDYLMTDLLRDYVPSGGSVLDPFMGSCPVGVACVLSGRTYTGIEINSEYYQLSRRKVRAAVDVAETQLTKRC